MARSWTRFSMIQLRLSSWILAVSACPGATSVHWPHRTLKASKLSLNWIVVVRLGHPMTWTACTRELPSRATSRSCWLACGSAKATDAGPTSPQRQKALRRRLTALGAFLVGGQLTEDADHQPRGGLGGVPHGQEVGDESRALLHRNRQVRRKQLLGDHRGLHVAIPGTALGLFAIHVIQSLGEQEGVFDLGRDPLLPPGHLLVGLVGIGGDGLEDIGALEGPLLGDALSCI